MPTHTGSDMSVNEEMHPGGTRSRLERWLSSDARPWSDEGRKAYGSFVHAIDGKTGDPRHQYTEITGYGASLFSHLYRWTGDDRAREIARDAGSFLLRIQLESGAFPDCPDPDQGCYGNHSHTFDTAMCAMGLLDLHTIQSDSEYLDGAIRACRWLTSLQREDGSFPAAAQPVSEDPHPSVFFGDGSCIHVKNSMPLLKACADSSDARMEESAVLVCDYVLDLQADEGFFWAMPSRSFVFTHAHCYACEGLLSAAAFTGRSKYRDAAIRGIRWLSDVQNNDGSFYQVYHDRRSVRYRISGALNRHKAADATAQSARLFRLAGSLFEDKYRNALSFLERALLSASGGLYYTAGRFRVNRTLYAWPAMFALQAYEFDRHDVSARDLF